MRPHNLPYVMLGAGLLWFGWFGFNAGSALAADGSAALIAVNTPRCGCGVDGGLAGRRTDPARTSDVVRRRFRCGGRTRRHHAVVLGGHALGALAVGIAAGAISCLAIELKFRWGYDDSLDVVGVHFVSGVVGTLMIGLVASSSAPAGVDGLFYGGGLDQLWRQAVAVVAVMAYAMAVTAILAFAIDRTIGLRADRQHEADGIDDGQHAGIGLRLPLPEVTPRARSVRARPGSLTDRTPLSGLADTFGHTGCRNRLTTHHTAGPTMITKPMENIRVVPSLAPAK